MKASFLAVAVLATIAISSAVDEECVQRKLRGLPIHWPNPTDCSSFYRCTNKNVKRELLCPTAKEYNPKTGRCVPLGKNLCKLSLRAALEETTSPCANKLSGTYVPNAKSCRGFNICNDNLAYPQSCDAGSYFSGTAAACLPDTDSTCWENLCVNRDNGVYLSNDNDCYSFYICSNQVPVAQDCPKGSYFDKDSLNCKPGVCPADVTTETSTAETTTTCTTEATTTCTDVITTTPVVEETTVCSEETTIPELESCANNNCDQSKCVNAADNSVFEALKGNSMYCVCLNHVAVCRKCVEGSEFNPTFGICLDVGITTATTPKVVDTTTPCTEETTTPEPSTPCKDVTTTAATECKCDATLCKGAADYSSFPALDTNVGYCVCLNEQAEYRECPDDTIYDMTLKFCVKDTGTPKPVLCAGGHEEGDFVPNPNNCMLFYICFDGELVETSCGTGNYFNVEQKNCMPDSDGKCPECTNVQPAKTRSKRSVTQPKTASDQCCPGGYQNGQMIPHPTDCSKMLVCCNGEMKEESCEEGYYFNEALNECVKDVNKVCSAPTCVEGSIEPYPSNCSMWLKCCHGVLKEQFCDEGYYFNPELQTCQEDVNNECWPKKPLTCKNGLEEGQVVSNPANCSFYLKCTEGQLVQEFCGEDYYFNSIINSCVQDTEHKCWPVGPTTCEGGVAEGEKIPSSGNCSSYSVCCNGVLKTEYCNKGYYFNANKKDCIIDDNNVCWPGTEPSCIEGEMTASSQNCSAYILCCHGVLKEKFCSEGYYFSNKTNTCVADTENICWPTTVCTDGDIEGILSNCSYLICCNGDWTEESCNEGYYFNSKINKCELDTENICGSNPTCTDGEVMQNPANCSSYLLCCNGDFVEELCDNGDYFNNVSMKCVSDIEHNCWPKPSTCTDGEIKGNSSNCSYLICCNGDWTEESCNEGYYFNSKINKCELDTENICGSNPTCTDGEVKQNPANCSSYLLCCTGDFVEKFCDIGDYFNNVSMKCVSDIEHICWPKPSTCTDGEIKGNSSNCSYLICCNGDWTEESCNEGYYFNSKINKCELDTENICGSNPTCTDGEVKQNPANCSSYLVCCTGAFVEKFCDNGDYFNNVSMKCVSDIEHICWPKPSTCTDGEIKGNSSNCSYLICCNGDWTEESCNEGYYFNSKINKCELDTENICGSNPTCTDGEVMQNPANCSSYLLCCTGDFVEKFCDKGDYFNNVSMKCVSDIEHICWPKPSTCTDGEIKGNSSNCSYLICCNGDWTEESCNEGYYFNNKINKCELDTEKICGSNPTCTDGEVMQNPANCSSYLLCCTGDFVEKFCDNGDYFNNVSMKCVSDIEHICWPKPSTCTDGEIKGNSSNCSYLICCNGDWTEESCNEGYYFNSKINKCELDTENICGSNPTCTDGEVMQNPANCSSYLLCSTGDFVEKFCDNGDYFNNVSMKCVSDIEHICWPKPSTCTDGEIKGNSSNCSYLICCNGDWTEESCNEGYYFNSKINKCELDTENICGSNPTCTDGEVMQNPANCSSYLLCCTGDFVEKFCDKGDYFNNVSMKCVSDIEHICWPKPSTCTDGEIKGNSSNCSYLICCNGDWTEESCNEGYYFNNKINKCELDTEKICGSNPTCTDGEVMQNPANCSSYLLCCTGDFVEKFCDNGDYFNNVSMKCVSDIEHICWPKPSTCTDGEIKGNSSNCSYLICCNGDWTEESCSEGYYFNSKINKCELDTENICGSNPTCTDGEVKQNPANCSSYLLCSTGDFVEKFCDNGDYFNNVSMKCVSDIEHICWPKPSTCTDGEIKGNSSNCSYLICCNGDWTEESCNEGYYFNSKINKCELDTENICGSNPTCTDGEVKQNPANCSSYLVCCTGAFVEKFCDNGDYFNNVSMKCVSDIEHICWPKPSTCKDGEIKGNSSNCSYLICCNGDWTEESCSEGYYFNSKINKCELDTENICGSNPTCTDGELKQNPANCSSYLMCCTGAFVEKFCDVGYYFSNVSMKCEPDTEHICWPTESCKCTEGDRLPSEECDKFYACSGGELVQQQCGLNYYFNATYKTCEQDLEHVCWKNYCADQLNGTMVANPKQCNAFYLCEGGESTDGICPNGQWFDSAQSSCQPDVNAVCYNPCACQDKITVLPHPDCTKFYWCNGNQTFVGTCSVGGFDETIGACNPKKSCSTNECEGKPNYYVYADPEDKTKVYVCMNGVPVLVPCPPGTEFNGNVCAHVSDPDCDASPCLSPDYVPPYATLNATEVNAFCMCRDGYATKQYCSPEYVFSSEYEACYSNAPCDPMVCKYSPDYYPFVNRNDTNSFCLCVDNEAVIVECPSGSFNPYSSTCTNVEISEQCDQLVCRGQSSYYTYPDKNNSVNGFCRCESQVGVFVDCPENSVYDSTFGVCKLNNINCDSSKCQSVTDNTKLPALTTTLGYCECVQGTATYYNCLNSGEFDAATQTCLKPVCDPTKCLNAVDYTAFPATNTTTGFCLCINNEVQYHDCDVGGVFNNIMGMCMMPLKNCDDTMCAGQTDNTKVPAWSTFNGYCLCTGGKATYKDCLNGWVFDKDTQACGPENRPIEDLCDTSYCDDPANAGQTYPSTTNAYGYCVCASTGPAFNYCPEGQIFNTLTMSCAPSVASQCDLSLCAHASPDNTYSTPAKNGNTSFCFCSGPDNVMLLNCPSGKYYNNAQQLCISAIAEGCSCPNGLKNGDRAPDATDCTQYFVCNSGKMHQQSCPSGQYFNTDCNNCIEDDGTCVAKEACTCLGAYREGERILHPYNNQMYYVCENKMLHERNCGSGRIFNKMINQCMRDSRAPGHFLHKRSVDVDEFVCIADEKRSVPSNCSQYEICIDQKWKRRSCPQFRYYNPEQQKCLEPRDDTICAYAKVEMLPACSAEFEQRLHKGRSCQQYFRCHKGKWRLKNCGKSHYFEESLATCLPHGLGDVFECNLITKTNERATNTSQQQCQHLSVRPHETNCAMYLMCLESLWWYQYCPLGTYFNRSLQYCISDTDNVCPQAIKTINNTIVEDSFVQENCTHEGVLRPSALACNRYYICIGGQWQQQQCANQEFYDVEHKKCSTDTDGICSRLQIDCEPLEKREFPLNCSRYEECSSSGKWSQSHCPRGEFFDTFLKQCVPNDGICSAQGLKRVCQERATRPVILNCTQFYFCEKDDWILGNCLNGHMYSLEKSMCMPHSFDDKCQPLNEMQMQIDLDVANQTNVCDDQMDGTSVAHPTDCTRYFICVKESLPHELQCAVGSFYDSSLGYCRPNDGSCRLVLSGVCANVSDESLVAHPTNCQAYYSCSTLTGQQLMHCPEGQYYHNYTRQCRIDHGECKGNNDSKNDSKCLNLSHGTLVAHERYCNIYYVCVKGLAIPVECHDDYQFNALLGKCIYDADNQCQNGELVENNQTYSCGNLSDGSYIADRQDCTRYYICSEGQAQPKKCAGSAYFDSDQLLCVPDDGSCPYVDDDEPNQHPMPPDPIVCEGKHGYIMPDPLNCNSFYVCINSKLRHERCYSQHFFNTTSNQCQPKPVLGNKNVTVALEEVTLLNAQTQQCADEPISVEQLCKEYPDGFSIAEQSDCRLYTTCQEDEDPISQRCRNGESFDSLLGFCRQNDGTCLLENGQRAGECSDRHGQLARDTNNCRKYFVCVNGQKIKQTCQEHEYFSKSQNMCINDTLNTCHPAKQPEEAAAKQSCAGLSESVLYPYIHDNCRSYFQCIKGVAKVHQCADDLYFDPNAIKCVRDLTECVMSHQTLQRTPVFKKQTYEQLCSDRELDHAYANVENHCRSFYTCRSQGELIHELCPLGKAFDQMNNSCVAESKVICV